MSKFIRLTVIEYIGSEITKRVETFLNADHIVEFQQQPEVVGYHPAFTSVWQTDGDEREVVESARWIAQQLGYPLED